MAVPKRLYKYESLTTQTLRNIKAQVLHFGSPMGFNDPYDCALTPNIQPPSIEETELLRQKHLSAKDFLEPQRREFSKKPVQELREHFLQTAHGAIRQFTEHFLKIVG